MEVVFHENVGNYSRERGQTMPMKLAVINDWKDHKSAVYWNKDGFLRMLGILRDRDGWDVRFFKAHDELFLWEHDYVTLYFSPDPAKSLVEWEPDAILGFSDLSRAYLGDERIKNIPVALCYTGGRFTDFKDIPKITFVESKSYLTWFHNMGVNAVQAFGANTDIFKPDRNPKIFDAYFPATGAAWKRHEIFAEAMKNKGIVSGWWQPHEPQCLEVCKKFGVAVLHHQLPESVNYLYNMAHTCVITSSDIGGSQRSVLEAMACNRPVIVMADSTMTSEYVEECEGSGEVVEPTPEVIREAVDRWMGKETNAREWIMRNYSPTIYADKVKAGIESIL